MEEAVWIIRICESGGISNELLEILRFSIKCCSAKNRDGNAMTAALASDELEFVVNLNGFLGFSKKFRQKK